MTMRAGLKFKSRTRCQRTTKCRVELLSTMANSSWVSGKQLWQSPSKSTALNRSCDGIQPGPWRCLAREYFLFSQRTGVWFPAPRWLTTTCSSRFRGSDALSCLPQASAHMLMCNQIKYVLFYKRDFISVHENFWHGLDGIGIIK